MRAPAEGAAMAAARREEVARLSMQLERALMDAQRKARAPRGMVKCPLCGAAIAPTKNGRIRVHHDSPVSMERCPASGKMMKSYAASARKKGAARLKRSAIKKRSGPGGRTPQAPL